MSNACIAPSMAPNMTALIVLMLFSQLDKPSIAAAMGEPSTRYISRPMIRVLNRGMMRMPISGLSVVGTLIFFI